MPLIVKRPWTSQPQVAARVDWGSPLTARITHLLPLNGDPREIVTGARLTYGAGGSSAVTTRGLALQGSGVAACASVPIDLSPYTKASVSFWMYWDAYANDDKLAMEYGANYSANSGFLIDPNSGSPATGLFQAGVGSPAATNSISFSRPSAAAWHHYVFLFDRTTGTAPSTAVYVDGVAQSTPPAGAVSDVVDAFGNNTLYIFSRANTSLFGAGKMQNLAIRGGYLMTAAEARQEYSFPWQLFAPLPRRIWAPSGSTAATAALAATGETAAFSAAASGGTLAALATTGSTGAFAGTANSVSSGSLAAIGSTGAFSAAANSTTSVVLAATGESGVLVGSAFSAAVVAAAVAGDTGTFAGSAGAGTSAVLSAAGASGAFVGAANSTTTAVLSAIGDTGTFSGAAGIVVTASLSAVGGTGVFSGAAASTTTVALAATGATGTFSGAASSSTTVALAAVGSSGTFSATAAGVSSGVSAADVWAYVLSNGKTAGQTLVENNEMLRIVLAAVSGKTAGIGGATETYFGSDGTTPRVIATFDAQGNRVTVVTNGVA